MWTTVSTSSLAMPFAMTGLRMSARTKETSPTSPRGGRTSTPLTRRTEDKGMQDRLDGMAAEQSVRDALEDFNRRVRYARLQLQGGPPVVTRYRDVDAEVAAWRERAAARREARQRAADEERAREAAALAGMTWRERRRARRMR